MLERTITTLRVEARAFYGGARKVRHFDTIAEADAWLVGLQAKHAGVATQTIEHTTTLGVSTTRSKRADREYADGHE